MFLEQFERWLSGYSSLGVWKGEKEWFFRIGPRGQTKRSMSHVAIPLFSIFFSAEPVRHPVVEE